MRAKMTLYHLKNCIDRSYLVVVLFIGLFFAALMPGCSSVSTLKKKTLDITAGLKIKNQDFIKKAGIAVFENRTTFTKGDFEDNFQIHLVNTLKEECPEMLLLLPDDPEYPEDLIELPKMPSGQMDNLTLAKTGRQLGLNAIITGSFIDIRTDETERGFWWFKELELFTQVQIGVEVYDVETGAKLLDESFIREIEMGSTEDEMARPGREADPALVNEAIIQIATEMGNRICEAVEEQAWSGYIISSDGNKIVLSSGEKAGLKSGDILEVHESENIINGAQDQRFFVPGLKTGEIRITDVYPERSEAVSVSGNEIKAGSSVRSKE